MKKDLRGFSIIFAGLLAIFINGCGEPMDTIVETVVDPPTESVTPPIQSDVYQGYTFESTLDHQETIHAVVFSPDGQTLASLGEDSLKFWNPHTVDLKDTSPLGPEEVRWMHYLPDGLLSFLGGPDTLPSFVIGHTSPVRAVAYSSDRLSFASGSSDKTVRVWDLATRTHKFTLEHEGQVWAAAFSPDGQTLASGDGAKGVRLWDADTGNPKGILEADTAQIESIAFSSDGQTLFVATGRGDGEAIHIWDLGTNTLKGTLMAEGYTVRKVAISPDGQFIAGGAYAPNGPGVLLWKRE